MSQKTPPLSPEDASMGEKREKDLEQLKKNEKIYRELFEKTPIGIFRTSSRGRLLFANAAMARTLGFPSPEAMVAHYRDLASQLYMGREKRDLFLRLLQEKGEVENFDFEARRFDGTPFWMRMTARLIPAETSGDFLIEGFITDITLQIRAEETLRRQFRLQHLLMEIAATYINLPLGEIDAAIQKSLGDMASFVGADRAYIFLYDFERQICTNTHEWCRDGVAPQIRMLQAVPLSCMQNWVNAHTLGHPIHIPEVAALPAQGVREVLEPQGIQSLLAVPMMQHEKCLGFIGLDSVRTPHLYSDTEQKLLTLFAQMLVNIGLRRQAQEQQETLHAQLMQAQKMESVGRLAGGVAHDFNNMLSVIIGHAELVLDDPALPATLRTDLRQIHQAARRSADLTRQLLAFARKQATLPRSLDLNETVGGMLKMLQRLIGEDIRLDWIPGNPLWPVLMDPGQIDQILANLCVNARDAIEGAGRIVIRTRNGSFDHTHPADRKGFLPGDYVVLSISDTGCGMGPEVLPHLFEPFFTTKALGKGTGLGLATVYGIVKQNGGYIDVQTLPGKGCTFDIYLPRHRGETAEGRTEEADTLTGASHETILVAEDEPAILGITQRMLKSLGYTVLAAASPEEALRAAREHAGGLDLLITDVIMPGMNGRDLAEALLAGRPGLRVLFTSGYTADIIDRHGVLEKGVHFIQKPFSLTDLARKVRDVLDLS